MRTKSRIPLSRPRPSRALEETRAASRLAWDRMTPGQRMEAAFAISLDARKLRLAGLRALGLSEAQIRTIEEKSRK